MVVVPQVLLLVPLANADTSASPGATTSGFTLYQKDMHQISTMCSDRSDIASNKLVPIIISQPLGAVESHICDVGAAIGALAGAYRDAVLAAALHGDGVVPLLPSITRCEEDIQPLAAVT